MNPYVAAEHGYVDKVIDPSETREEIVRALDMLENNDYPTMQQWAYTLLLEWAKQDPVDEIERKRKRARSDHRDIRRPRRP